MSTPERYKRNPTANPQTHYRLMPWTRTVPGVCEAYQYSGNIQSPGWPASWSVPLSYEADGRLFLGAVVGRQGLVQGAWLIAVDSRSMKFVLAPEAEFLAAFTRIPDPVAPPAPTP